MVLSLNIHFHLKDLLLTKTWGQELGGGGSCELRLEPSTLRGGDLKDSLSSQEIPLPKVIYKQ